MKRKEHLERQNRILHKLSSLPKQILLFQEQQRLPEFILHEISCEDCLNLNKAAFLVDNPDFDCLKGIAGVSREELFSSGSSIWEDPHKFSVHMDSSEFNNKVRNHTQVSCKRCETPDNEILSKVAEMLGMKTFNVCTWNMKHDNHGFLLYEKMDNDDTISDEYMSHGASILGFCPIH